jgi:hypothetical protein
MSNEPKSITQEEWHEIVSLPQVRGACGLSDDETAEHFASRTYSAKFKFQSGGPGYSGDLYILQGDALSEDPPMVLIRREGKLEVAI